MIIILERPGIAINPKAETTNNTKTTVAMSRNGRGKRFINQRISIKTKRSYSEMSLPLKLNKLGLGSGRKL